MGQFLGLVQFSFPHPYSHMCNKISMPYNYYKHKSMNFSLEDSYGMVGYFSPFFCALKKFIFSSFSILFLVLLISLYILYDFQNGNNKRRFIDDNNLNLMSLFSSFSFFQLVLAMSQKNERCRQIFVQISYLCVLRDFNYCY